jgi:AcrR family transcriptional regulator
MRVTAETRSATRQRILDESQRLFAAQGFEAATTRDIARAAGIGVGTLFNYFPSKEAVAHALVSAACESAAAKFAADLAREPEPMTLEEELFAHVAAVLRKLKPYRKYVTAILDTHLAPQAEQNGDARSFQAMHLEIVGQIAARHGASDVFTAVPLHLYWTLFLGVLSFWSQDRSPKQEDTLALLDQSLAMFCGWLTTQSPDQRFPSSHSRDQWSRGGSVGASPGSPSPSHADAEPNHPGE